MLYYKYVKNKNSNMKYDEIAINDPISGEVETFTSIRAARAAAKRKSYTPVYIDLYDENEIIDDIRVDIPGAKVVN